MGVVSYEMELTSTVPAARMFKAFFLDADNLMPKLLPQAFKNVEIIEGDGGPGTIKKVTFGQDMRSQLNYMKVKIEGFDKDNFNYSYSVIEGDPLTNMLEKISYELKLEPTPDGGSIFKESSKYHTIGNVELKEEQLKAGKESALAMFKAIEAYLLTNPDY